MVMRSGEIEGGTISRMGVINNLQNADFELRDGQPFFIKNDGYKDVELQVRLIGMAVGEFINTTFAVGWNREVVKEIRQTPLSYLNIKWGY